MSTHATAFAAQVAPDGTTVSLRGDVSERCLPELRAALAPLESTGGTVNLTAVTFLPSRAIGVVLASRRRAREAGHEVRLVAAEYTVASSALRVTSVPHDPA